MDTNQLRKDAENRAKSAKRELLALSWRAKAMVAAALLLAGYIGSWF
jgi:hypothetical protein